MKNEVIVSEKNITIQDVINVAKKRYTVNLDESVVLKINSSNKIVTDFVNNNEVRYGITTGFGNFSDTIIPKEDAFLLQKNLIMSHACGVGKPFSEEIVRAMLFLRLVNISKGHSGTRIETAQKIVEILNSDVVPYVPEKGSLGASGDLAPLSHAALTLIGLGEAFYKGEKMESSAALKLAGIEPLTHFEYKEGLSLINGTQAMTSTGLLVVDKAIKLMALSDISLSLSLEALRGITNAFENRIHELRPHKGQIKTAKNVLNLVNGSKLVTKQAELRTQDAYSLRCAPQVHGACKDAVDYVKEKVDIEINSVTDNPLIFEDGFDVISAGNFHGEPMALSFDFLAIALSEIANISERRIERLVNPALSNGLPAFLVPNGGLNSGMMIVQYSAASLVSENKVLSHPASVDSIPSSANQEDHVSMGTIAARKSNDVLFNTTNVIAMEILCACQGISLRGDSDLGEATKLVYDLVRTKIPFLSEDRILYKDIDTIREMIEDDSILNAALEAVPSLLD